MNMSTNIDTKVKIGQQLLEKGVITVDQLDIALTEQKKKGRLLGEVLVTLGFVSESIMRDVLSQVLGIASVDLSNVVPDMAALSMIEKEIAERYIIVPVSFDEDLQQLKIAMKNAADLMVLDRVHALVGRKISLTPLVAGEGEIKKATDQFYGYELSVDGILHEIETGEIDYRSLDATEDEYSQPLVRLVDAILADAVKREASDIHFEPEEGFLRLRYRVDGVLRQIRSLHKDYWSAIVVRLKVMCKMNIAETRIPQDGRLSLQVQGHSVDFRVSAQPTTHGENIVLRVLDRAKGIVPMDKLGIHEETLNELKLMMARPEGIILVTGPTGSGKTTTLYSLLNYVKSEQVNIMTLEDPVEYPMDMIRQTSVNEVARMDFANGIRSMMRQDPDIILVGEIRDEDTAEMAFRAAMTGHQVLSTLHTNSAIGTFPRLLDIGVLPDIMTGNIIGVISQRLIRLLCPHCKTENNPDEIESKLLDLEFESSEHKVYEPKGCEKCDNTGYKGRVAIIEALRINSELDEQIAKRATLGELKATAKQTGYKTLADDAIRYVLEGRTSLTEVSRVIDLTQRLM
ncbi:Type II secretion system protein E [hydrothermal vent metagenome]|uniref:Type II secretion system protein E n=1 Tax=hydrothermal vent metagenome TaxID=652676 RepID=A0A3B0W9I8_9ZZZZ